jgi:hypothetical protein
MKKKQHVIGNEELVYNTDSNKKRVRRDLTIVDGPDMREVIKAHFLPGFIRYV